ncbi:MAG: hypothetical protein CMQ34_12250 [Gammaproteobacteria bacterium]|nr:hypothetical protein [Gammaproteobacteria bacterium]
MLNGKRLGLTELNLAPDRKTFGSQGRWGRFVRALEAFLAGMYTGESCAGTPRDEHGDGPDRRNDNRNDGQVPDRVKQPQ